MNRYANRYGKFYIRRDLIEQSPQEAAAMLQGMVIVRAEMMVVRNAVEYVAMHPEFAKSTSLSAAVPEYIVEVRHGRQTIKTQTGEQVFSQSYPVKRAVDDDDGDEDDDPAPIKRKPKTQPVRLECGHREGRCTCYPASAPTTPQESKSGVTQKPDFLRITRECSSHD